MKSKSNAALIETFHQPSVTTSKILRLVWQLSVPAIMAQIVSVVMQYIDAAMVGSLGAQASASIGIAGSPMGIFYGLTFSASTGFTVQIAQAVGAEDIDKTKKIVRQAYASMLMFALVMVAIAAPLAPNVGKWLGAEEALWRDSGRYCFVFACSLPIVVMNRIGLGFVQASGNVKLPSLLSALVCLLDMLFNFLYIYPTRPFAIGTLEFMMPGAGLGVMGAAMGTCTAELVVCLITVPYVFFRSPELKLRKGDRWRPTRGVIHTALAISIPMALQQTAMNGAFVVFTRIVATLGTVAIAAHSFANIAESLVYMPGEGLSAAASTLTGQSVGAERQDLAKRFAWTTVAVGMVIMGVLAVVLFFAAPYVFMSLTPDLSVRELATQVLRIEMFAEPLFAAAMIASGSLRGAGDTLFPALIGFGSMWGVRLPLGYFLSLKMGLRGVWIAMATELCVRGILFLIRLRAQKWQRIEKNK